ncbi:MAG: hypothetical protein II627_03735 [Lachnospiraceae bacterium]|nr:hypothetical protein [Lachnospiraceae bacterium]
MSEKKQDTGGQDGKLRCIKCGVMLKKSQVRFLYLDNGFPAELPVCPECGFIYVSEELALGKILAVEKALEDK